MKRLLRFIAHKTVLRPPYIRYCSQTIYESLLGCIRMFEATGQPKWRQRADRLVSILMRIQRPDGGFDIGYDFNFGFLHKKGQSTSPELVGLIALTEYGRLFDKDKVFKSAKRAARWIKENSVDLGKGKFAVPYGPYSSRDVVVYNGVSFAAGALGCYLGYIEKNEELYEIYHGMIKYLESVMSFDSELPGGYWYYNDQSRLDMTKNQRGKIDNYHQMQQVEVHSLAQKACNVDAQAVIILNAADYVAALQNKQKVLPYTNSDIYFRGHIHLWGLASVASGMLEAAEVIPNRKEIYFNVAQDILNWTIKYGWSGRYFYPILYDTGFAVSRDYMVRSDAWVFNALAAACKYIGEGPWSNIAEKCFAKMESVDFSGPESHAMSHMSRCMLFLYRRFFGL